MAPRKKVNIALVYPYGLPVADIVSTVRKRAYFARFLTVNDSLVDYTNVASRTYIYNLIGKITAAHISLIVIPTTWGDFSKPKKGRASYTRFVYRLIYGGVIAKKQRVFVLQHGMKGYWYGDKDQLCGAATEVGLPIDYGSRAQFADFLVNLAYETNV